MHLDLPRAVRARLDPDERFGLRLSLVAIAVLVVAIPFAYLTFEVLGAGPLTRLDARVANDLNAWAYQRQNLVRGLEAVSLLAKPITLWLIAGAAVNCSAGNYLISGRTDVQYCRTNSSHSRSRNLR